MNTDIKHYPGRFAGPSGFATLFFLGFVILSGARAQDLTNLFFLHHSVGDGLVVAGGMRAEIGAYNSTGGTHFCFWDHGYNSDGLRNPSGAATGTNYGIPGDNTDPDGLFNLWVSAENDYVACRNRIMTNHQVIAFKSCYPASRILGEGALNTYKTYYLAMRNFFDLHPEKLFVVMSPPPLHRLATDEIEGYYARSFANWLKSGDYLTGHTNTVCFDLFGYLAGSDNFLAYNYESSHTDSDSHPNSLADQTVGPALARFLVDAAVAYNFSTSSIPAPANVTASAGTYQDKVRVAWSAVTDASAYLVYRHDLYDVSAAQLIATTSAAFHNDSSAQIGFIYYYWVKARAASGVLSAFSLSASGWRRITPATSNVSRDLDGDGLMDMTVYRETNGAWESLLSASGYQHIRATMGGAGSAAALADFDGDRRADPGFYNASSGMFAAALSSANYQLFQTAMGGSGFVPEPGDYDGDTRADPVVYSASSGKWRAKLSSANYYEVEITFGGQQYRAVPADYDGDRKIDPALCDEQTGIWIVKGSARGYAASSDYFGVGGGRAVPSDYDGDGLADPAVYYEESGLWEIWYSGAGYTLVSYAEFGGSGFTPCPGDYDGDGLADPAVYNTATGAWRALFSTLNYSQVEDSLGEISALPVGLPP